jgi:hypothetical protein
MLFNNHLSCTLLASNQVVYLEACESGSVFEGLLPNNLSIYATTASNAFESSWGTYCPGMVPPPPPEYITCLGDLYSVSWMEDRHAFHFRRKFLCNCFFNSPCLFKDLFYSFDFSESQDLKLWSLQEQYDAVRRLITQTLWAHLGQVS